MKSKVRVTFGPRRPKPHRYTPCPECGVELRRGVEHWCYGGLDPDNAYDVGIGYLYEGDAH